MLILSALGDEGLPPATTNRGYVQVPSVDVQRYVEAQARTAGLGFVAGVFVGAAIGTSVLSALKRGG